jgi:glycosyltransferase involved in cell wall biosynthesis
MGRTFHNVPFAAERAMKVLMVGREFPPYTVGGVAGHTLHLSRALRELGVNLRVISFGDPKFSTDTVTFVSPKSSIISRSEQPLGSDFAVLCDIGRFTRTVNRLVAKEDFDIVHIQEPYVGGFVSARVKITTIHTTSYGELSSLATGPFGARQIEKSLFYIGVGFLMEYASIASSNLIIAPSPNIRDELTQKYHIGNNKTLVMGLSAANLNKYSPIARDEAKEMLGMKPSNVLVFTSARHISRKRLDVLLQALSILEEDELLNGVEVRIGGDGPLRPHLQQLSESLGISSRTTFLGWLPRDALELHYRASDIFVSCSEYEASSVAILEAMIAGAAVVSTRIRAFPAPAMTTDGTNILLVPPKDPVALANAIQLLARDKDLRERISVNAKTFALQYSWRDIAQRTLGLYELILGQLGAIHKVDAQQSGYSWKGLETSQRLRNSDST